MPSISCYDFTPTENYPGYREGDNCLLGRVENNQLVELYSTQEANPTNLNKLEIDKFHPYQLQFLYFNLVDETYHLSKEVLDYLLETKQVTQSWITWYKKRH